MLTSNGPSTLQAKLKKALFIDNIENSFSSSHSCEFGPDGIKFVRQNIKVTKEGMCKLADDQITPLSIVCCEEIEFGAEIGHGASGKVQEGIYKPQNLPIAIKTINIYDKDKRHQVVNDLHIFLQDRLEQLNGKYIELSSHLVQVYGAYYDEGSIKIILELMDGGSLRDVLNMAKRARKCGPYIEEPFIANIAYQILSGLHFIHAHKKQIHRDIKPENILMNSLGQVKLSDFGISKQLENTNDFSKTFIGTVTYMSPERLVGEAYGFESDIWGLGLILIELATGEYPYPKTKKFIEMLQRIMNCPEPNIPENEVYSDLFRDFVSKCLQKDPKKRWTALQLMDHPWLVINSGLNLDLSEWIARLLFNYKYTDHSNLKEFDFSLEEVAILCNNQISFEGKKIDVPSLATPKLIEQPSFDKHYSIADTYDTDSNHMTIFSQNSVAYNHPENNLSKMQSEVSIFELSNPNELYTQCASSLFDENGTPSSKRMTSMDFEIENLE